MQYCQICVVPQQSEIWWFSCGSIGKLIFYFARQKWNGEGVLLANIINRVSVGRRGAGVSAWRCTLCNSCHCHCGGKRNALLHWDNIAGRVTAASHCNDNGCTATWNLCTLCTCKMPNILKRDLTQLNLEIWELHIQWKRENFSNQALSRAGLSLFSELIYLGGASNWQRKKVNQGR